MLVYQRVTHIFHHVWKKKHNLMIRLIGFLSAEKMVSCKALKMQPGPRAPGPQMCKLFDKPPS